MSEQKEITVADIQEIVEIAVDDEVPNFTMEGNWYEDFGMDSLGAVALVVEVQKRYDVRLPEEVMPEIRTGHQLVAQIEKMRSEAVPA